MTLRVVAGFEPSLQFDDPVQVWAPSTLEGALAVLRDAERALDDGYWIAGALSYEFGTQLAGLRTFAPALPLLVLGAFRSPQQRTFEDPKHVPRTTRPLSRVSRGEYEAQVDRILRQITDGEVYQVNYTVPFDLGYNGTPFDLFTFLARRAHAPYSAFVEHEAISIASISPELFLRFDGRRLATKPMKGTAPLDRLQELHGPKNRAEHVMIVDLLRNDLHRICDNVFVARLFEIERYPTFGTMTSTICGDVREGATLEEILRATFPCGSVTGAPKRAAMQHIAAVEHEARGYYTGAIGFLSPQRRGWFNVPIRTLQFVRNAPCARVDIGGGIVTDSNAASEWREIRLKSRFLEPASTGFELLETLRGGPHPSAVAAHLNRLSNSATAFGMELDAEVFTQAQLMAQTEESRLIRLRAGTERTHLFSEPLAPTAEPVAVMMSHQRVRSDDPLLRHKTAWRPAHDEAAKEAREAGCFDAILTNERGEITEGSRTNIFVRYGNTVFTPPLTSGVLPGILRARLVTEAQAVERVLYERDLWTADAVYAGNSARGLLQARLQMNDVQLYPFVLQPKMAPAIWGGDALVERFGKPGDPNEKIGESWECWDENRVINGPLAGRSVAELRRELGAQFLGDLDPGRLFPILTKIIDARLSLSVQVHPDDAYAQRVEHQQNGKTECWYVMDAQPGAELVMGWTSDTSREEYERRVADGSLGDILHRVPVKAGDAFYIPAGTLHAIGAGIIIFETQQASDLTYRIFDWNRVGPDGKPRELHVQKAADVLDYHASGVKASLEELTYAYEGFQRTALIADPHFIVERIQATETAAALGTHGRPLIIMALGDGLELSCAGGDATLEPYQTALIPAAAQQVAIRATAAPTLFMAVTPPASPEMMQKRLHDAGVAQPIIEQFLSQFRPLTPAV